MSLTEFARATKLEIGATVLQVSEELTAELGGRRLKVRESARGTIVFSRNL